MLRPVTHCAFVVICAAALVASATAERLSSNNRGGPSRPKLKFASELGSTRLETMFSDARVISDLSDLGAGVSLAILDMTPQRASVVRRLNQANIPVTAWLLLPKDQGYFFNAKNAAAARFDAFEAWSDRCGLHWDGIGLDIEPDFEELQRLAHGGLWQLIPALVRRGFDHQSIRNAREEYQQLIARIHRHGYRVEVYQIFFAADQRRARSTLLERLLGVVDVSGDRQCLMLYTSFQHSWGDSVIWAYGPEAGTIVIGSNGGDSKLDEGFAPLNWAEFLRDLRSARYWTNEIGVYSLEGCVRQGMVSRLRTVDWKEDKPVGPPSSGLGRIGQLRAGIAAVLWVDKYAYVILVFLLGMGWLGVPALYRRRSKKQGTALLTESGSRWRERLIRRHPVFSYFVLAYAVSWVSGAAVTASYWMHGEAVPKIAGLMMFPAMLLGPSIAGAASTTVIQGRAGWRYLLARMHRIGRKRWLVTLAIPPVAVLCVLYGLSMFLSPVFAANRFWIGLSFGCTAGFFEEIGWIGFAFPAMNSKQNTLGAATLLGVLWAAWHIPVIDFLGSATPHGTYWLSFLVAFAAAMIAIRVLICWIYCNTNSVLLAQMFHASSTGALATFGPAGVTAGEEALWYAVYALVLWTIVASIVARFGVTLVKGR